MSVDLDPLFPTDLSNEAAAVLCDFLHDLAAAADSRFLAQILRYRQSQAPPLNPDQPWQSP